MSGERSGRMPPDRFTADDVEILPPRSKEELWADPRSVGRKIAAISWVADTFSDL